MIQIKHDTNQSPRRVLIYRIGTLGDTLIALPSFHLIARTYPDADRRLLTSFPPEAKAAPSSAVLEGTGLVTGYFRYFLRTRSIIEIARLWWELRRWGPQVVIYLNPSSGVKDAKRNAFFFRLCGVDQIIGLPITDDMQNCRLQKAKTSQRLAVDGYTYESEAQRLARNIAILGDAHVEEAGNWSLNLSILEHEKAATVLQPMGDRRFFAVSFGTKHQANEWGESNWAKLLERLAVEFPNYGLVICGSATEFSLSERAASAWRSKSSRPGLNLCGVLTPRESAAVFKRATLYFGHDSGPMHMAASVGTPCIAIFSSRNLPGIWFPYGDSHQVLYRRVDCEGCSLSSCHEQQKKCILSISVDDVMTAAVAAMSAPYRENALQV